MPGGRVWWRSVGDDRGGVPVLCLHGGPGFAHDYLDSLDDLGERRRVIFYDQLGCGRSDRPADPSLWVVDRFIAELVAVRPRWASNGCISSAARGAGCWRCNTCSNTSPGSRV